MFPTAHRSFLNNICPEDMRQYIRIGNILQLEDTFCIHI